MHLQNKLPNQDFEAQLAECKENLSKVLSEIYLFCVSFSHMEKMCIYLCIVQHPAFLDGPCVEGLQKSFL